MPDAKHTIDSWEPTGSGCLTRLLWLGVGNVVLGISAVFIAQKRGLVFSAADGVFWASVILMILVRRVDITILHGWTATGEPATMRHWRRYAVLLPVVGALVWAGAHAWAYFAH